MMCMRHMYVTTGQIASAVYNLEWVMGSCSLRHRSDLFRNMLTHNANACPAVGNSTVLTHWGRVKHICVSDLTIIGSDNGLSPGRHQAIIWANAELLLNGPIGTNFSKILIDM